MIQRFLNAVLARKVPAAECQRLLAGAAVELRPRFLSITPLLLDDVIWKHQRDAERAKEGPTCSCPRRQTTGASRPRPGVDRDGADTFITLPYGGTGARFPVRELLDHIRDSGRDYIIQGQVDLAFADHKKKRSLDYWLREKYATNRDVKQATNDVIAALVATGLFAEVDGLVCPDDGRRCKGIQLLS